MAAEIRQVLARTDNFAVLIHDRATGATAAIDAPDEASVLRALEGTGWHLTHILVTHQHHDHVEGIPALKARFGCRVIAPAKATQVPGVDQSVGEGALVSVGTLVATVMETPGHCPDHVAYRFDRDRTIFVGDTLFALGCGRIFGSTPAEYWATLLRLAALPPETHVYCGHEYTLANARFALTVDPHNNALKTRALEVENRRAQGLVTLPTTIGAELRTNPFLRAGDPAIAAQLGMAGAAPASVFAELRERKNRF